MFDNCLEFLHLAGRSLPHAAMMMVPEPWAKHESMSRRKSLLRVSQHADGAVGRSLPPWLSRMGYRLGRLLDRNGLRPSDIA